MATQAVRIKRADGTWQDIALMGPPGPAGPASTVPGPAGPVGGTMGASSAVLFFGGGGGLSNPASTWTLNPIPSALEITSTSGTPDFTRNADGSLTVNIDGIYDVTVGLQASAAQADGVNASGSLKKKAGATPASSDTSMADWNVTTGGPSNNYPAINLSDIRECKAGDRIAIYLWHSAASAQVYNFKAFSIVRLGGMKGDKGADGAPGATGGNATVPIEGWHLVGGAGEPAFQNSWVASDSGVYYRKDPLGRVYLRGSINGGANGTTVFTLPAGYRPALAGQNRYRSIAINIQTTAGQWEGQINIDTAGNVLVYFQGTVAGTVLSLDQVDFDSGTVTAMPTGPQGPAGAPGGNATVPIDPWHIVGNSGEPAYTSPWIASGTQSLRFRKDPLGRVWVVGTASGGASPSAVFTLPAGYRPPRDYYYDNLNAAGAAGSYVNVSTAGVVSWAGTGYMDLSFDTETVTSMPTGPQGPQGLAGGMVKIADATLVGTTILRFASIPQTYSQLKLYVQGQSNRASIANTGLRIRFNGVTAGYYTTYMRRDYTMAAGAITTGRDGPSSFGYIGQTPAGTRTSDARVSMAVVEVPFYAQAGTEKHFLSKGHFDDGVSASGMDECNGFTTDIAAITQIDILDDVSGALGPMARATLYGIP